LRPATPRAVRLSASCPSQAGQLEPASVARKSVLNNQWRRGQRRDCSEDIARRGLQRARGRASGGSSKPGSNFGSRKRHAEINIVATPSVYPLSRIDEEFVSQCTPHRRRMLKSGLVPQPLFVLVALIVQAQYCIGSCLYPPDEDGHVIIPAGVTSLANNTFYDCRNLKSIFIPYGVLSIGRHAFYHCRSLKTIALPEGIKQIGAHAFQQCTNLEAIQIPLSVTSIGKGVFRQCSALKSISIPSVAEIPANAFQACSSLQHVAVPRSVRRPI
jgi:hypothetical protein